MSLYIVAGTGKSGIAAAKLLIDSGDSVLLFDEKKDADIASAARAILGDELRESGGSEGIADNAILEFALGNLDAGQIRRAKACVISPGIPLTKDWVFRLKSAGVPIWSEIELAWRHASGKLCAITGTNGKTTTTALTGEIFQAAFPEAYTLGNIGVPYTEKALKMTDNAVTALEVSSFQLETIDEFKPDVSAILNLTPDHLDRHGDIDSYFEAKKRIAQNQRETDVCILNYEDSYTRAFGEELINRACAPKVFWFSKERELEDAVYFLDNVMTAKMNGQIVKLIRADELQIIGRHNHENALAAAAIALNMGVEASVICETLKNFSAVEHRLEYVREKDGVIYYNDSKGTNPDSTIKAIDAMTSPTLLIAGGYDKKSDFHEVLNIAKPKLKKLILLGETAAQIEREAKEIGISADNIVRVDSLKEAVEKAAKDAEKGDCVLLSPACASWDMFPNYEVRGREFKELVNAI